MCKFNTAVTYDKGVGGGCTTCRCQDTASPQAEAEAAAAAPVELSSELELMRYFSLALSQPPPPDTKKAEEAEAVQENRCRYSPAMEAELQVTHPDRNNNSVLRTTRSLPCEKRRVQFADEVGGSLTEIRMFQAESKLPVVVQPPLDLLLQCHFETPTAGRALRALMSGGCNVQLSGIRLDRAGSGVSLNGFALVQNVSFRKRVFVRISSDKWRSSSDLEADFAGSMDHLRDAFEFEHHCEIEEVDLEFCVCFEAEGHGVHWDSNGGANYRVSLVKPRRAMFSIWGDDDEEGDF